jgi:hypothetical protein
MAHTVACLSLAPKQRPKALRGERRHSIPKARGRALPLRVGQLTCPCRTTTPPGDRPGGIRIRLVLPPDSIERVRRPAGVGVCRPGPGLRGAARVAPAAYRVAVPAPNGERGASRPGTANRSRSPGKGASGFFARAVAVCPRPARRRQRSTWYGDARAIELGVAVVAEEVVDGRAPAAS